MVTPIMAIQQDNSMLVLQCPQHENMTTCFPTEFDGTMVASNVIGIVANSCTRLFVIVIFATSTKLPPSYHLSHQSYIHV